MFPIKCEEYKITSKYGNRSYMYQGELVKDFHYGIDLIGGTEILAYDDGEVVKVNYRGKQYGNACYVRIKHNGYYTLYYHLKDKSINVKVGDKVTKGQVIGLIGNTGKATGIHLHFQIDFGTEKTAINPEPWLEEQYIAVNTELSNEGVVGNATALHLHSEYVVGETYTLQTELNVRRGSGTQYSRKLVKDLSIDGRKNATSTNLNSYAILKKGTRVTVLDVINKANNVVWLRIPSGYICAKGSTGQVFVK